jgi:hypothetical protein
MFFMHNEFLVSSCSDRTIVVAEAPKEMITGADIYYARSICG